MKPYKALCLKITSCFLAAALCAGCGGSATRNEGAAQSGDGKTVTHSAAYLPGHDLAPQTAGEGRNSRQQPISAVPADSRSASGSVMTASAQASKPKTAPSPESPAPKAGAGAATPQTPTVYRGVTGKDELSETWNALIADLTRDIQSEEDIKAFFTGLEEYSCEPMGKKVAELFKYTYGEKPPAPDPKKPRPTLYTSIMTEDVASKCMAFLKENKKAFDRVEKAYDVPREVIVALLFIETRLGTYLGKDNAMWSLACMASASTPDSVSDALDGIPYEEAKHKAWLQSKLNEKSKWAYKELKALIVHCRDNSIDPKALPGSVYGAIGICQFMPSNLKPYAVDGDGDGIVDLFNPADAIFSTANYLTKHGWKKESSAEARRKTLKRYNNLNIYANSIIELSEAVKAGGFEKLALARKAEKSKKQAAKPARKAPAGKSPAKKAPAGGKKA